MDADLKTFKKTKVTIFYIVIKCKTGEFCQSIYFSIHPVSQPACVEAVCIDLALQPTFIRTFEL